MSTLTDPGYPTLVNMAKRLKPDGSVETQIADTLSQELPMLDDIPMVEGNLPTGHRITSTTALPSPTWRKLNAGLTPAKGETLQYDESCGLLEAHSKVDVALANLGGNAAAFRMSEDKMFLEGMAQEAARALFYENVATSPEKIHGFSTRYPASTGYTASKYVIPVGTQSGTNAQSIWVISWDPERIFGIFPKGSVAGLQYKDLGERLVRDASNNEFLAYASQYVWKLGLAVKDYRYAVRIQWDPDDSTNCADSAKGVYLAVEQALGTVWRVTGATRIYWSRKSRNKVAAQLASNDTRFLEYATGNNGLLEKFLGVPARITDTLTDETAIS